jgi:hypothetical protein
MQNFVEGVEVLGDDEPSYPATGPNTHETPNSLDFGSQDEPVEFPTWANTETIPPNGPQQAIIKESSAAQTFFSSLKLYELVALSLAFVVFNLGIIIYEGKDLRAPQFRSVSFKTSQPFTTSFSTTPKIQPTCLSRPHITHILFRSTLLSNHATLHRSILGPSTTSATTPHSTTPSFLTRSITTNPHKRPASKVRLWHTTI